MRSLVLLYGVLLVLALGACGGAGGQRQGSSTSSATSQESGFLNDGDNEREGDADGDNNADNDKDPSLDYLPRDYHLGENHRYEDADDIGITRYGHAADPAEQRAVEALVRRYYAAAAAGAGAAACSMLSPSLARAVPAIYGQPQSSSSSSSSQDTCAAVTSALFARLRRQLAAPIAVTGVRIAGSDAYALLGSTAFRSSYIVVRRSHGSSWRIDQLLGSENVLP